MQLIELQITAYKNCPELWKCWTFQSSLLYVRWELTWWTWCVNPLKAVWWVGFVREWAELTFPVRTEGNWFIPEQCWYSCSCLCISKWMEERTQIFVSPASCHNVRGIISSLSIAPRPDEMCLPLWSQFFIVFFWVVLHNYAPFQNICHF